MEIKNVIVLGAFLALPCLVMGSEDWRFVDQDSFNHEMHVSAEMGHVYRDEFGPLSVAFGFNLHDAARTSPVLHLLDVGDLLEARVADYEKETPVARGPKIETPVAETVSPKAAMLMAVEEYERIIKKTADELLPAVNDQSRACFRGSWEKIVCRKTLFKAIESLRDYSLIDLCLDDYSSFQEIEKKFFDALYKHLSFLVHDFGPVSKAKGALNTELNKEKGQQMWAHYASCLDAVVKLILWYGEERMTEVPSLFRDSLYEKKVAKKRRLVSES